MNKTSEIQNTIFNQCNWKALKLCGFKLGTEDDNKVLLLKGRKTMQITYAEGNDDYTIKTFAWNLKGKTETNEVKGIYNDQLQELIMNFWSFEIPEFRMEAN